MCRNAESRGRLTIRVTEERRALTNLSNRLLSALRRMRDTERRKRQEAISSPRFHELATEVEDASQEVFRLARLEERVGDESPRGATTIDDVDRQNQRSDH
jgi:hypothetical protein